MSFLATLRTVPIAGQLASNIDTTTLQPGQAFDLRTYLFSIGVIRNLNITTRLTVTINSGVTLFSSSTTKPVMTISNFKQRDKVIIINNGNIHGAAGSGGLGGYQSAGNTGLPGGNSLLISNACSIINNGTIKGGGGGNGGAGGINNPTYGYVDNGGRYYSCYGCGAHEWAVQCDQRECCCVKPGCGRCGDTCGWPNCSDRGNCNQCSGTDRNGFRCSSKCARTSYVQTGTSYATGGTGAGGVQGSGLSGNTGASNSYTGGPGGLYGYDISGYSYAILSGSGTTAGHYIG